MPEINYARAQARWLVHNCGAVDIELNDVVAVRAIFSKGMAWSEITIESAEFYFEIEHKDGRKVWVYVDDRDGAEVDLSTMVVEGLEMEAI